MNQESLFTVTNGLSTLGPDLVEIRQMLEGAFTSWAAQCGAGAMLFPPLMLVEDLAKLDYFRNFPHLALIASPINQEVLEDKYVKGPPPRTIPSEHLTTGKYALPSAACYNIYLHLQGATLGAPKYVTTVASCFRNELHYTGLERLWGFSMREIVCVGSADAVKAHLGAFKEKLLAVSERIGLSLEVQVATDPFFQQQSNRALMQQIFPVKEEFVYKESVAIASVNFHRNFFGERCDIRTENGEAAFSGCVAFGIERWLHALVDRFEGDVKIIKEAVSALQAFRADTLTATIGDNQWRTPR